jgi:kynurenine formamidase
MNEVLRAMSAVREGTILSLGTTRFRGMPNLPGHPHFDIVGYRTPEGLQAGGEWPLGSAGCSGFLSELILGSAHTGTHMDALAHVTVGDDHHWHGGGSTTTQMGDFGPLSGDASQLPPVWTRGVLLDVAAQRGVDALGAGEVVSVSDLEACESAAGVAVAPGDAVLIRTGYMSRWPDEARLAEIRGAGPGIDAARWLTDRGVRVTGSDTESYEAVPGEDPDAPFAVHAHLIAEHGIPIIESLDLEALAQRRVYEFLFVALPLKIRGATGSMIDPIAVL